MPIVPAMAARAALEEPPSIVVSDHGNDKFLFVRRARQPLGAALERLLLVCLRDPWPINRLFRMRERTEERRLLICMLSDRRTFPGA